MKIIPLEKWVGKSKRCPKERIKKGCEEPVVNKSEVYIVRFPNETMITVYNEKSFKQALAYEEMYETIQKKALERIQSGEAYCYGRRFFTNVNRSRRRAN